MDQSPKKSERLYEFSKIVFAQTFHGYVTCANLANFFAKSKNSLRIGKKTVNFSLMEKIFQQTVPLDIYCCFDNPEKGCPKLSGKLQ